MVTPVRKQYLQIKTQFPNTILFFRLGDFYETFDDDARIVASELDIVLTSREMGRDQRVPLAGIPYHSVDTHLAKLVSRGFKVAICEQVGDPATSKGLVEREVVRVVTPGTVVEANMLDSRSNNYLAAVALAGRTAGVAYIDITTGEFGTTQLAGEQVMDLVRQELERLQPAEVLVPSEEGRGGESSADLDPLLRSFHCTPIDVRRTGVDRCRQNLQAHFGVGSLEGFGCSALPQAVRAAGAILSYLAETQKIALAQIDSLRTYQTDSFMVLDAATRRNLELAQNARSGETKGTLVWVLDKSRTPMGARLLRKWIGQPLLDVKRLNSRLDAVGAFVEDGVLRARVVAVLEKVGDLERLINRVGQGVATPRDLQGLRAGLGAVPQLRMLIGEEDGLSGIDEKGDRRDSAHPTSPLRWLRKKLDPCEDILVLIAQALVSDPPNGFAEGGVIAPGFSDELDGLRSVSKDARQWVARLETTERERTGIKSLKVGYNKVFGYYLEVSNPNLDQSLGEALRRQMAQRNPSAAECRCPSVREHLERCHGYIRKQTLVGAERFITPDLKEQEALILGAQERIVELETRIFKQVCEQVVDARSRVQGTAEAIAYLDGFAALAEVAVRQRYVRPELDEGDEICVVGGRHPVVEMSLLEDRFVPNDVQLSNRDAQLVILTGPNMAGKSTYLLMVGLITLMAQIGSYVPAEYARIGIVDRIFTRVGAQHDISGGQSTFMIEMTEFSAIATCATPRSLVILDEIGRGTSTYDGISIAQAAVEYIHNHPKLGCKTLFATHYHELTDLEKYLPRVRNFRVDVLEEGEKVVFLRRVVPGGADKSYGIHVARLAGVPKAVTRRAEELLRGLERDGSKAIIRGEKSSERVSDTFQLSLFSESNPVLEELKSLDVLSMTPMEAIAKLFELQNKAKRRDGT